MSSKGSSKGFDMILGAAAAAGLTVPKSPNSLLDKAERDELAIVALDDPLMAAAMRKARALLPEFLVLAANPRPSMVGFAVKVAIREGEDAEYFWIHPFDHAAGQFSGLLNNTPRSVRNVKMGDKIKFTEREIVDWMYMDGEKTKGNYTARALIQRASPEEREAFRKRFGLEDEDI
jgi:uncharacterized protein YegJ (DUF2314 family)